MTERDIFLAALDLADRDARTSFLDEACAGKPELRAVVEELLAAHEKSGRFLNDANDPERTMEASGHSDLGFLDAPTKPGSLGRLGHYEILSVLGRGGFGIVFKAFDDRLHRVVAIKALAPHLAATSPPRKRFIGEARTVAAIKHENVVAVFDVEEKPIPYLVMEFVAGETLQAHLDRTGPLDLSEIISIAKQIAKGLEAAHATGLIHRDIKPANILLEAGPELKVKITDFGLARATDDAQQAQSGAICGTPMYMSPEQAQGKPLDVRSDLFSLGSVMYVMASGRPPFRAESTLAVMKRLVDDTPRPIREIVPTVPEWLCGVIGTLQSKNPADRYATAKDAFDAIDGGKAAAPRLKRTPRFSWSMAAAILLPILAGAFVVTQKWWLHDRPLFGLPADVERKKDDPKPPVVAPLDRGLRYAVGGAWQLEGGVELVQTKPERAVIHFGDPNWTDYTLEVEGQSKSGVKGGQGPMVLYRVQDPGNFRELSIGAYGGTATETTFHKGGQWARVPGGFKHVAHNHDHWYKIKIEVKGTNVTCSIDGKPVFAHGDAMPLQGMIGLATWNSSIRYRLLKVTAADGTRLWEGFPWFGFPTAPSPTTDSDRKAAEFILQFPRDHGIQVQVDDVDRWIGKVDDLPKGTFRLTAVHVEWAKTLDDAALANFAGCRHLKTLKIWGAPITEKGLVHFVESRDLETLEFTTDTVNDAALKLFEPCTKITRLAIASKNVSDEGLTAFRGRKLKTLSLAHTKITDRTLDLFPDCPDLTELSLYETRIADAGLKNFRNSKRIEALVLAGTGITDDGLASFAGCTTIKHLNLASCTGITNSGLANFQECRGLEMLSLDNTPQITDAGIAHFAKCKNLGLLHLFATGVTDDGLKAFQGCKRLGLLNLSATKITAGALAHFKDSASLATLYLSNTKLGDESIDAIGAFSALRTVHVIDTRVTSEGRKRLKEMLPNAKIE